MIEPRELIAATRQMGGMMEAGVDILRALKVLRSQTGNADLLALYDRLAHELRLGSGLADAMSRAPEAFSPFAVSLVRQGEARGDLATSFYRIADYLQKEAEFNALPSATVPHNEVILPVAAPGPCPPWLHRVALQAAMWFCVWLGILFLLELAVAIGIIIPRWHLVAVTGMGLIFWVMLVWRLCGNRDTLQAPGAIAVKPNAVNIDGKSTLDESSEATFE